MPKIPLKPFWTTSDGDMVRLYCGNALDVLNRLPESPRLIFADPPYNIGVDYGKGVAADHLSADKYMVWCERWMRLCRNVLTSDGGLWVMINDEWAGEFSVTLTGMGLHRRSWIKWYETFGVNCQRKFNRCSRHIFHYVVDPNNFVFNIKAVSRPSDRQTKYGDKRANPDGKILDDVWTDIPRLCGTHRERIKGIPTQLPVKLLERIIGCASDPGDLVCDPFLGSGTTAVAAVSLGRRCIGIELSGEYIDCARKRLGG